MPNSTSSNRKNILIQARIRKYHGLTVLLFVLNVISALMFIISYNHMAYDDRYNLTDVHRYAINGISVDSIKAHINPAGPTSYIWMAMAVRLFPENELRSARAAILLSWLLLGAMILIGAHRTRFAASWYSAFFVTLAFPHAVSATALVLTEGPALLFAILGSLLWIEFLSQPTFNLSQEPLGIASGFLVGLAITCRQYYLALLLAAVLFVVYRWRQRPSQATVIWVLPSVLALTASGLPVLLLALLWKGFSSPGMVSGSSYANWRAAVGINFYRPVVAGFYVALYSLPLTFPAMLFLRPKQRWRALLVAFLGAFGAVHFMSTLLQPGPFNSLVGTLSRMPRSQSLFFGLIAGATICNFVGVSMLLWEKRAALLSCPPVIFSIFVILFFIAEQVGVQGNIPFYDRYVIQVAPFLGIIAFGLLPELNLTRVLALGVMSVTSEDKAHVLTALGKAAKEMRSKLGESGSTVRKYDIPLEPAKPALLRGTAEGRTNCAIAPVSRKSISFRLPTTRKSPGTLKKPRRPASCGYRPIPASGNRMFTWRVRSIRSSARMKRSSNRRRRQSV